VSVGRTTLVPERDSNSVDFDPCGKPSVPRPADLKTKTKKSSDLEKNWAREKIRQQISPTQSMVCRENNAVPRLSAALI
jgi:hypothetical protein